MYKQNTNDHPPMSKRRKILAIDDDPAITDYLRAMLGEHYALVATNEPAGAIDIARAERPDLILCDVDMQNLDGYAICRQIRAEESTRDVPIIFLTTKTEARDEARGLDAGAVDYIHKHLDRAVIEARVRTHLALHDAQYALRNQNAILETRVAERTRELEASREALREAMHNLRTTRVTSGVYWVQVPEAGIFILCGSPADVVKHLMLRGLISDDTKEGVACETGPNVILLSDVLVQNGRFANLAEFPVLQMLYRQGLILPGHPNNTGRKPMILGSESQVRAQLKYIHRGNYGLASVEELKAAGLGDEDARIHMALKLGFAFGKIRASEELLDYRVIENDPVDIAGGVRVRRIALNRFEFSYRGRTTEVDLNLKPEERYEAPYGLGHHQVVRQYFGVIHCGEGDGWDLQRQSMGSIVMFKGRYYLVDAGPSIVHSLQSLGIDVSEIEGIFHTHAHDDHFAGLPSLIASGHRIKYYATPLVRHSVMKKLAALMSMDEALFADFFDVRDLKVNEWNDCHGLEVMPIYSPHPVENNIFVFRVWDEGAARTYAHWADIASIEVLRRMAATPAAIEVLPPDFVESIRARYLLPVNLKKIDSGGGLIHGEPLDFSGDDSDKLVLAHRAGPFTREELEIGSQASFGAIDVLIPTEQDYVRQQAFRYLSEIFPDASMTQLDGLLRSPVVAYNAGSLILRRGYETHHVYLSLAGSVEHSPEGFDTSFTLPTGSFIGAQALFDAGPLADTWRTVSSARLLRMDLERLRTFLSEGGWLELLRSQLAESAFLQSTWLFGERVTFIMQGQLARASKQVKLRAGQFLRSAPAVYLVRTGSLDLVHSNGTVFETLGAGGFAGEEVCLGRHAAPWRCVAREDTELLAIAAAKLRTIPVVLWKLLETHDRRLRSTELYA
ncbi:MAG: response regulator [Betaproteobacteria bacterium]|nr:response regulator [Betaproteobacteria bacterium]